MSLHKVYVMRSRPLHKITLRELFQPSPNPPEFAQPFEQVKLRSCPTRGYKFGCVCSYVLVLPRCEDTNLGVFDLRHFALLKRGL